MTIKDTVLEPYEINFDGTQYTLIENCISEKGNTYTVTHGYFVDFVLAVKKLCQLEISKKEDLSLKQFIDEWKKMMAKFKPLFYEN